MALRNLAPGSVGEAQEAAAHLAALAVNSADASGRRIPHLHHLYQIAFEESDNFRTTDMHLIKFCTFYQKNTESSFMGRLL